MRQQIRSTNAVEVMDFCMKAFATHRMPVKLSNNNGPAHDSIDFKVFLENLQIKHVMSSPYHPKAIRMAEREVQEAMKVLQKKVLPSKFYYALLA